MNDVQPEDYTTSSNGLSTSYFRGQQELLRESLLTDPLGGMHVLDELSNAVHNGIAFSISASGTLAAGATDILLGRTGSQEVHFSNFSVNMSKGFFTIALYEAPTITSDGTPIASFNRKRSSSNTATMSTFAGTTVSNNGTLLEPVEIYDTGGQGSNTQFGVGVLSADWVLAPNTDYIIVLTNSDASATDYSGHFIWAERNPIV